MNATNAAELFGLLASAKPELSKIRRSDFAFLKGIQLDDYFYDVVISGVEPTAVEIDRSNLEIDGTLSLRVELLLSFKRSSQVELEDERAVLWLTSDGEQTELELADAPDGPITQIRGDLSGINMENLEALLRRFSAN